MSYAPHLSLAHSYWRAHLRPGDGAVDATCGNGRDLLLLSQLLLHDPGSYVIGIDIQKMALERTALFLQTALSEEQRQRVQLLHESHAELRREMLPFLPRLIVYNLGYLPKGNHLLTTLTESTLESVRRATTLLAQGGAISIMTYSGHPEGAYEERALITWAQQLDRNQWTVCHHQWINRLRSPSFLWICNLHDCAQDRL